MTTNPEVLYPRIRACAPGVSDFFLLPAVIQAARNFCKETWAWQVEVTLSIDVEGTVSPKFDSNSEYYKVYTDGVALNEIYRDYLSMSTNIIGISWVKKNDQLFNDYEFLPPLFRVNEKYQGETFELNMRLALEPALDVEMLPDFLVQRYDDALVHGALSSILLYPGQDFSNPELAKYHGNWFRQRVAQAKMSLNKDFGRKNLRVQTQKFI